MGTDRDRHLQMASVFPLSPNGSVPRCKHVDGLAPVTPRSDRCPGCQALGATWTRLQVCLSCGWVACSDDSPHQHGRAHYQETDHPVAGALEPGSSWKWCYVHRREV
ncbi:UBP-type zinc finger domain-containing protein [Actinomadura sp. KC216]|uniref:UBP-type zinc finger domain-containing protein n=1 Tax=Actinomadura sp. KC216 TaxID=2530370 RepID=UPI001A9D9AB1|nr:UBP-type zinc finger domain-containing protein [Actinomadura sp. KC216]